MYLAVKDTKIIAIHEVEWQCRRKAKNLNGAEYWAWLETVTTEDENKNKTYDFSGEDYEIIETNAPLSYQDKDSDGNDVTISFNQSGHIQINPEPGYKGGLHLKWDGTKIVKDDEAKAAWELAWKWTLIRRERTRLLAETDYLALKDSTLSEDMKTYRQALRDVPKDNSDPDNITWPSKPE